MHNALMSFVILCVSLGGLSCCRTLSNSPSEALSTQEAIKQTKLEFSKSLAQDSLQNSHIQAVHGMIVFGKRRTFFYHLPMWREPHVWHIVIEGEFNEEGKNLYQNDQQAGSPWASFEPMPFPLSSLQPGFVMKGLLYHGHFEQGGTPLPLADNPKEVSVTVKRMITVKALNPSGPKFQSAIFRVFGGEGDWYASHLPTGYPDFDQVLSLAPSAACPVPLLPEFTVQALKLENLVDKRLQAHQILEAATTDGKKICMPVTSETYFSTLDLGQE